MTWIEDLRQACRAKSQRKVAAELGVSTALISQVLNGVYQSDTRRLQALVEGRLLGHSVQCPVLGELNRGQCISYQESLEFSTTNPYRIRLRNHCPECQHNLKAEVEL